MPASTEELIAINSLLIDREAAFAQVHTLESKINQLLGAAYPFEAPEVELPSSLKKKKPAKAKKTQAQDNTVKVRRLNEGEVAYRVTWIDKAQTVSQEATDIRSVDTLVKESLPGLKLIKIETVDLDSQVLDTLFPS